MISVVCKQHKLRVRLISFFKFEQLLLNIQLNYNQIQYNYDEQLLHVLLSSHYSYK